MSAASPVPDLIDFLYRDQHRIASYYAQIFGGRLISAERTDSDRSAREYGGGIAALVKAEGKDVSEVVNAVKKLSDPHDVLAVDLIDGLIARNFVSDNWSTARSGTLVRATGTVFFSDGNAGRIAAGMIGPLLQLAEAPDAGASAFASMTEGIMGRASIPSAFLLEPASGHPLGGTLKDDGMEQPIPHYHFKHGDGGLPGVEVIGVKEVATPARHGPDDPTENPAKAFRQLSAAMSQMFFHKDYIRVTPLAIFRRLPPAGAAASV